MPTETATFAAGCFWSVEAAFRQIPGVTATSVGYMGGDASNPSYKQVCTGRTGHAEAVRVEFDSDLVSYERLLDVFWDNHNPTTRNRQGWDLGSQYRSAIFFADSDQQATARSSLEREQAGRKRRIVTEVRPVGAWWEAEDSHQQYLEKRGQASCAVSVAGA